MSTESNKLNTQIYEEAAEWFVDFREGDVDAAGRRRFAQWLRTSPEHMRAYLELAAIYNEGPGLDPEHRWDAAEVTGTNVVTLDGVPTEPILVASPVARTPLRFYYAIAASFVVAIALVTWVYSQRGLYTTEVGEQRSITLSDGTNVELNAKTRLRVMFSDHARVVRLIEGQALFQVTKDPSRPFIVESEDTRVRAVGTAFDVYRRPTGTTVTVVEGRVAVTSSSPMPTSRADAGAASNATTGSASATSHAIEARAGEFLLAAGEQAVVTPGATLRPEKPDIAAATAWTQRRLVFAATALSQVAEEFNRYNPRRLTIEGPELQTLQITGIFSSTDPDALVRFLKVRSDIVVTESADEILVTRRQ
jgi:transmembrane sensor